MRTLLEAANRFLGEDEAEDAKYAAETSATPAQEATPEIQTSATEADQPVEVTYEGAVKDWLTANSRTQPLATLIPNLCKQFPPCTDEKAKEFVSKFIAEYAGI